MKAKYTKGNFVFKQPESTAKGSVLYAEHLKLTSKSHMADFAGYLMPLWFSSISAEHQAVRQTAGLFDCSHMGILEFSGSNAQSFLNVIATNDVARLSPHRAQYSYILDAAGNVLDDIIIYKRDNDRFMVVVNASNEPKIKAYLNALRDGSAVVDADDETRKIEEWPRIRDMRDTNGGTDCRVDIALGGPAGRDVIVNLIENQQDKQALKALKGFCFLETRFCGIDCIIARTGYTGSKTGYEFYVHPDKAVELWDIILKKGKCLGIKPCGLGARDSLRIEAGLPLYGHELAGKFNISPFEAGYSWAVKLDKKFFIGKKAMEKRSQTYDMRIERIELPGEKGIRPVRQNDAILNSENVCIGWILSASKVKEKQIALAYSVKNSIKEGERIGVYYLARNKRQTESGKKDYVEKAEYVKADIIGTAVSRFENF